MDWVDGLVSIYEFVGLSFLSPKTFTFGGCCWVVFLKFVWLVAPNS